jgi:predicted RNase H-like HicB family nuclease
MVIPGQYNEPYSSAVAKNDGAQVQQFAVIVRPNLEEGGFIATVPGRPDVVGRGKTEEAALEDARMALESTSESGDGEAQNGAEDPEGTPRPFDARPDLAALASEQGVEPADDFDALLGDFWPEGEDADKFVSALRTWRRDDIAIIEYRPEIVAPRTP